MIVVLYNGYDTSCDRTDDSKHDSKDSVKPELYSNIVAGRMQHRLLDAIWHEKRNKANMVARQADDSIVAVSASK
jgi:hypothetical protein